MTKRIYYTDPYRTDFEANVLSSIESDGRPALILDQTAFYPTSGGQPFDTGAIEDVRVLEVIDREDGEILHVVERAIASGPVQGRVDWDRRFDHMQQHSGQHILSAAFDRLHSARTVSFHLGAEASTIDLARDLSAEPIASAEREANRIVWEDRPVGIRFASEEEAARLPLRKEPQRAGPLRLIDVENFDLTACGGTHVARTGAIGIIAVSAFERYKGGTRVEFVCGGRALHTFRRLRDIVTGSTRVLSVGDDELTPTIERMQQDAKELRRGARAMQERLAVFEAHALAARGQRHGGVTKVIEVVDGWDAQALKTLASAIASRPGHVAALVSSSPVLVVIARASDVPLDASAVLRALAGRFGGKGGGRRELAQGGGFSGTPTELRAALRELM